MKEAAQGSAWDQDTATAKQIGMDPAADQLNRFRAGMTETPNRFVLCAGIRLYHDTRRYASEQ